MRIAAPIELNDESWMTQSVPCVGRELLWHLKLCMLVVTFRLVLPSHFHGRERQMWEILAAWFSRGRPVKSRRLESLLSDLESSFKRARVDLWWDLDVATFNIYSKQNHFAGLSEWLYSYCCHCWKEVRYVGKICVPVTSQLPGIEVFVAHRLLFSSRTICEKCRSALRQHRGSTSKVHFSPITTTFCSTMPDVGYFYRYFLKIFSATSNYISSSASHLIASQGERRLSSVLLRSCTKHYIFPNSLSDI